MELLSLKTSKFKSKQNRGFREIVHVTSAPRKLSFDAIFQKLFGVSFQEFVIIDVCDVFPGICHSPSPFHLDKAHGLLGGLFQNRRDVRVKTDRDS